MEPLDANIIDFTYIYNSNNCTPNPYIVYNYKKLAPNNRYRIINAVVIM